MERHEDLEKLGELIKRAREKQNLTQEKLAYKIGKDHSSINRVERGKINPTYLYLMEVAKGLNMSLLELLDDSSED